MLAVAIELLTGRYVATAYNTRSDAEWPPHPARLFSALAATHFSNELPSPDERAALEWLEMLGPPAVLASNASKREVVTVFVPVNDAAVTEDVGPQAEALAIAQSDLATARAGGDPRTVKKHETAVKKAQKKLSDAISKSTAAPAKASKEGPKNAAAVLPEGRRHMPRTFPSVTPDSPHVAFVWPHASPTSSQRATLDALLARLVRLGHSSSLVSARIVEDAGTPRWRPADGGEIVLRTVQPGQLASLERAFAHHRETEPRIMPACFQAFTEATHDIARAHTHSVFEDQWIVLRRVGGPALPSVSATAIARSLRRALLSHAEQPIPETFSGHTPDEKPTERDHLAIVPLPFVGHERADGSVLGIALILPRGTRDDERRSVYVALRRWEDEVRADDEDAPPLPILLGPAGVLEVQRVEWGEVPRTLRSSTWCMPARLWSSATPIALDRNPGDLHSRDVAKQRTAIVEAEQILASACVRLGLPRPTRIDILPAAPLAGSAKARVFPKFPTEKAKLQRVLTHARITFPERVLGPILLGAGRYVGLGLMRPGDGHE